MGRCANENGPAKALSHLENTSYPDSIRELRSQIAVHYKHALLEFRKLPSESFSVTV